MSKAISIQLNRDLNPSRRFTKLFVVFAALLSCFQLAHADLVPQFKTMDIGHGIKIDVPSHWGVLTDNSRKNVALAGDSIAEKAGLSQVGRMKETLLGVNATSSPTGAMIRVSYTTPADFTAAELRSTSQAEFRELHQFMIGFFEKVAAEGGVKIIEVDVPTMIEFKGYPTLMGPYRRTSMVTGHPWRVVQYKIPVEGALIELTLSYREKDQFLWKPILEKVRDSIEF